ncbi:hypothetical protein PHJA_000805900 [Phtheirospermum japonicum]|uniref:DUF7356 domain-containing protein n=1 Tax=Phtheirospermum japonicum TaxID=374723 RepID=A0A830BWZ0_9LAMI|nr:hypothetical protein PHJA_000805900 [Phtheirospermum japonicum]
MESLRIFLLVIFLICVVPRQSDGSFLENYRKVAEGDRNFKKTIDQSPVNPLKLEACDEVADKCDIKDYMITACVPFVGNGSQASYILVVNSGESSLKLNIVVRPANITMDDIIISGQELNKVNLPPNTGRNLSISLNVEKASCAIQTGALVPQSFHTNYLTPINGAYIFFVAALFIGVMTLVCCKLVKKKRHLDGVPYQELEMGQQEEPNPSFVIETSDGWDQNWDDNDWDEEKAVSSPGAIKKGLENGSSLKYVDTTQWGNDWDD